MSVFRESGRPGQIARWSPLSAILDSPLNRPLPHGSCHISRCRFYVDRTYQAIRSPEQQSPWRSYSPNLRDLLRHVSFRRRKPAPKRASFQRSDASWPRQVAPRTITGDADCTRRYKSIPRCWSSSDLFRNRPPVRRQAGPAKPRSGMSTTADNANQLHPLKATNLT